MVYYGKRFKWYTILLIIMPAAGIVKRCMELNCTERLKSGYVKATRLLRLYIRKTKYGKAKWNAIGWYCPICGEIMMNNNEKYVPFNKFHILEFDYKQLLRNIEKQSSEQI